MADEGTEVKEGDVNVLDDILTMEDDIDDPADNSLEEKKEKPVELSPPKKAKVVTKSKAAVGRKTRAISKAKAIKKEDEAEMNTSTESKANESATETQENEKKNGQAGTETKKAAPKKRIKKVIVKKKVVVRKKGSATTKTETSTVETSASDKKETVVKVETAPAVPVKEAETKFETAEEGFDTRSEAGSSAAGSASPASSASGLASPSHDDKEKNPSRKRKISPIEWDNKSGSGEDSDAGSESGSINKLRNRLNHHRTKMEQLSADLEQLRDGDSDPDSKKSRLSSSVNAKDHMSKLKYIFHEARFFLIKSNNHENVALAKAKGVWSTLPQNEARLNAAYDDCRNVILIFSVKESGKFQGYARLATKSDKNHPPIRWVLPPNLDAKALASVFKLDWITRRELPFTKTTFLHNAWNENKPVKIGRDGQEIEPRCGEALCRLFPPDENIDLRAIVSKAKKMRPVHLEDRKHRVMPYNREMHPRPPVRRFDEFARRGYQRGGDFRREVFYKDRRSGGSNRYGGVRRETFLNGSYSDYMREFHRAPPMPLPGFPGPAFMEPAPPPYPHYNRDHRVYPGAMDYPPTSRSSTRVEKRSVSQVRKPPLSFSFGSFSHAKYW